jgi:hypothetical protein
VSESTFLFKESNVVQSVDNSATTRLAAAEACIYRLERCSRRCTLLTIITSMSLLAAAAYVGSGPVHAVSATNERTVQAPFKVVDDSGKTLLLVQQKGDQNQLFLFGAGGKLAVMALTNGDSGMLMVGNGQGPADGRKAGLFVDHNGSAMLDLRDADGSPLADIAKGPNSQGLIVYRPGTGNPAIEIFDNATTAKIGIRDLTNYASGIGEDDNGIGLALSDAGGKDYVSIQPGGTIAAPEGGEAQPDGTQGITLYHGSTKSAFIGSDKKGHGKLNVWNDTGSVAQLSVSSQGSGELLLGDPSSKIRAWLEAEGPAGMFLAGPDGTPVAEMTVATHGGRLWLGGSDGVGMIEGGVTDNNRGVMRAGPMTGGPVSLTGLPTAIMGHK